MSRGRPKSEKISILEQVFDSRQSEIIVNNKILPPKSEIWCEFNSYGNEKSIYTAAALRWWRERSQACQETTQNEMSMEISLESKDHSSLCFNSSVESEASIKKFTVVLSNEVWKTIEPCQELYRRKIVKFC